VFSFLFPQRIVSIIVQRVAGPSVLASAHELIDSFGRNVPRIATFRRNPLFSTGKQIKHLPRVRFGECRDYGRKATIPTTRWNEVEEMRKKTTTRRCQRPIAPVSSGKTRNCTNSQKF